MDANLIEKSIREELAETRHHVRLGRVHLQRQRALVEALRDDALEIGPAAALLKTFEKTQALHEIAIMRLEQELAALQIGRSLAEQSRSELRRRSEALKASSQTLASASEAVEGSRSLLDSLPEKP